MKKKAVDLKPGDVIIKDNGMVIDVALIELGEDEDGKISVSINREFILIGDVEVEIE